jgi:hypothetical protein
MGDGFFASSGNLEDICCMRDTTREVVVEVEFVGLQKALNFITNPKQKTALKDIFDKDDVIRIRRSSMHKEGQDRELFNPKTGNWENTLGRDTAWR